MFLSMILEASSIGLPLERTQGWAKGGALFDLGLPLYNKQIWMHVFEGI
jgi:hypothetical protein